jgi:phosphatidate cytidylyltransferase
VAAEKLEYALEKALLRWRLLAAAAIVFPVLILFWLDDTHNFSRPGIWLFPLAAMASVLAAAELLALLRAGNLFPSSPMVIAGAFLHVVLAAASLWWPAAISQDVLHRLGISLVAAMAGATAVLVTELWRFRSRGQSTVKIALAIFAQSYVGLPIAFLVHLRLMHPDRWGLLAVVSVILVAKMSDTGAYFFGRSFGRHKLAPTLSPGKTVEGAVGGLVAACFTSWLFFRFLVPHLIDLSDGACATWVWLSYAATISVAGIVGDLSESLIKRDMDCKDSSAWLPGLGGVLDVIDSILLAAPAAFFWWASGLLGR